MIRRKRRDRALNIAQDAMPPQRNHHRFSADRIGDDPAGQVEYIVQHRGCQNFFFGAAAIYSAVSLARQRVTRPSVSFP